MLQFTSIQKLVLKIFHYTIADNCKCGINLWQSKVGGPKIGSP